MLRRYLKHWCYVIGILAAKVYHGFCPGRDHLLQYGKTLDATAPLELVIEGFESVTEVLGPRVDEDLKMFAEEAEKYDVIRIEFVLPEYRHFDGDAAPYRQLETLHG